MNKVDVTEKEKGFIVNEYSLEIPTSRKKDFILSLMEYGYSHNNIAGMDYMRKVDNGIEKVVRIHN